MTQTVVTAQTEAAEPGARPWKITWWDTMVQSRFGTSAPMACSTFTGSSSWVQPQRRTSLPKCVSTVMPGMSKALPRMTLAVLRPMPGSLTSSSSVWGSTPSCFSTTAAPSPISELALFRKKPVLWIIVSSSARSAFA
jgi:hypothetical protein